VRLVADSHAIVWYVQGSRRLSEKAADTLRDAEASEGIVLSTATLIDLWYVTQTTQGISSNDLSVLSQRLGMSARMRWEPITEEIAAESNAIGRSVLPDPWDRLIVATARVLQVPLVTKDEGIRVARLVETIW
jgi:PIN domain nuclease of toxin-antitoxin system